MQVTLTDMGPPMFFLGDPRNLILSLSFANPGPVELDFDSLERIQQQKILSALQNGHLESDIPFQELYEGFSKSAPPKAPTPISPVADKIIETTKMLAEQRSELQSKRQEKEEKLKEKCIYHLSKGSTWAIKSLSHEEDPRYLRMLLATEQAGANRVSVLVKIKTRLKRVETELAVKINKATAAQIAVMRSEAETSDLNVVESEQRTVILTPEDLIAAGVRHSKP